MTIMTKSSNLYASAFFRLAPDKDAASKMLDAMKRLRSLIGQTPEYLLLLDSPAIPLDRRIGMLEQALAAEFPDDLISFMKVLCRHGQISAYSDCVDAYEELVEKETATVHARVSSAVSLTEEQQTRMKEVLAQQMGASIIAEFYVDPELIGGVRVETNGYIIDASLRHRLEEIKDVIAQ